MFSRTVRTLGVLLLAALAVPWLLSWSGASPTDPGDGELPDGTTVFDDDAGLTRLDPDLLAALRRAGRDAASAGVELGVNSGWRSRAYQERLLREAVAEHGSEEEAARWVAPPDSSSHVRGEAVDIGGAQARSWLAEHGASYGLCRTYDNEPWHFELRPRAVRHGCPERYADASADPRRRR